MQAGPVLGVHVIGDSHSLAFSLIPGCVVHWLGPITMHRVGRDDLAFLNLVNLSVQNGQAVVFAFGEIDVRCHIGRQRDLYFRPLENVLDELVSNYIYTILLNRMFYTDLICIVYSVTPPTENGFDPSSPYYGTLEDRINITKQLNARLEYACRCFGLLFLDVYNDYSTPEGSLIPVLSDSGVHINMTCNQAITAKLVQLLFPM